MRERHTTAAILAFHTVMNAAVDEGMITEAHAKAVIATQEDMFQLLLQGGNIGSEEKSIALTGSNELAMLYNDAVLKSIEQAEPELRHEEERGYVE
jgi:hypothetical protein